MAMYVGEGIHFVGDFFIFFGISSMVCLSIAAWILLICLLSSQNKNTSGTTFIFFPSYGWEGGYGCHRHYGFGCYGLIDIACFLFTGLIISGIVVGLALHMGLPSLALGLGVGWCAAFSMVCMGLFAHTLGDMVKDDRLNSSTAYNQQFTHLAPI